MMSRGRMFLRIASISTFADFPGESAFSGRRGHLRGAEELMPSASNDEDMVFACTGRRRRHRRQAFLLDAVEILLRHLAAAAAHASKGERW